MPEKITIVKDGGESISSNIVSVFMVPDLNKKYIITTENAVDPHGLTVLHVSEILNDSLAKVATDEEWSTIKTIMRAIISGSVGNYQYIPSFENINAAGTYSRDISVSAPASKQMIDSYISGEKVEPTEESSGEESEGSSDSIFPTAPVESSDNEVVPGISMDEPVTIENTPEAPEVDPSVQGAHPLDPATLPVQEPVPVAPAAPAPAAAPVPTPVITEAPAAPAAPVPAPAAAPGAPVAPAPVAPVPEPAPVTPEEVATPTSEVVDASPAAVVTPDAIVEAVPAVDPAPESILEEPAIQSAEATIPATPNGAAVAVPADPNAVEVSAPVPDVSVAPEIDSLAAAQTIVSAAPAIETPIAEGAVQDTIANATDSVVDVLAPVPDTEVMTVPEPIIPVEEAPAEAPAEVVPTETPAEVIEEPAAAEPVAEIVPVDTPVETPAEAPVETPAEAPVEEAPVATEAEIPVEVPEIPVIGNVTPVEAQPQQPQQPNVVVQQSLVMPQTQAMKKLGITLDFGSQPSVDSNATLDEIVAGAQELFIEGVRNLVLVMTEKLYKDLREKEEELKKREIVLAQREQAINDSTLAMMNGNYPQQPMMQMQQPMMGQPMMQMQQPMMQQPMMAQPVAQPAVQPVAQAAPVAQPAAVAPVDPTQQGQA